MFVRHRDTDNTRIGQLQNFLCTQPALGHHQFRGLQTALNQLVIDLP